MKRFLQLLNAFALLSCSLVCLAEAPDIDPAEDQEHFGSIDNMLFWTPKQQVAGYRNMDRLVPVRRVHAGPSPLAGASAAIRLSSATATRMAPSESHPRTGTFEPRTSPSSSRSLR